MGKLEKWEICPLCGRANNCQHGKKECWCFTTKIPEELIKKIPEGKKGSACICKSCVEKFLLEKK